MSICPVCSLPSVLAESIYTCPNGHSITNAHEIVDTATKKSVVKKKEVEVNYRCNDFALVTLFTIFYRRIKKFLNFRSDEFFKIYLERLYRSRRIKNMVIEKNTEEKADVLDTAEYKHSIQSENYFGSEKDIVVCASDTSQKKPIDSAKEQEKNRERLFNNNFDLSVQGFRKSYLVPSFVLTVAYVSKRCERERRNKTYFVRDFRKELEEFGIKKHLKEISRTFGFSGSSLTRGNFLSFKNISEIMYKLGQDVEVISRRRKLDIVGDRRMRKRRPSDRVPRKVIDLAVCKKTALLKRIFRERLRIDWGVFKVYLFYIADYLEIPLSGNLLRSFKDFVYANDLSQKVFIPELIVCSFLYVYFYNVEESFSLENGKRKVLSFSSSFECKELYSWNRKPFLKKLKILFCNFLCTKKDLFEREVFRVRLLFNK